MGTQGLNICGFIIFQMVSMTSSNKKLGFPCLIGKICREHSIAPIGNFIGTPKLVRPSIIKRMKMNFYKRQRCVTLDGSCDHTTLGLLQKIDKGVCKANSKVKCAQEQLCGIATKFSEIKEEINKIKPLGWIPMMMKMVLSLFVPFHLDV